MYLAYAQAGGGSHSGIPGAPQGGADLVVCVLGCMGRATPVHEWHRREGEEESDVRHRGSVRAGRRPWYSHCPASSYPLLVPVRVYYVLLSGSRGRSSRDSSEIDRSAAYPKCEILRFVPVASVIGAILALSRPVARLLTALSTNRAWPRRPGSRLVTWPRYPVLGAIS